ncbi:MAG: hypothetical protein FWF99_04110 [Desulfovibrionaceae bacterium]|nr:hypothetical protein [Desulfovibrionaceae bacterium]
MMRRLLLYIAPLLLCWGLLFFVVIPWENAGHMPENSFSLIEGERGYAMILRRQLPSLAASIRGLNLAGIQHSQDRLEDGRILAFGNVRIHYDRNGEFLSLRLLERPE